MSKPGVVAYALYGPLVAVAVACVTMLIHQGPGLGWFAAYLAAINAVALAFYIFDKVFVEPLNLIRLRVPERVLIWELAFPWGFLGAWLGMQWSDHKTGVRTLEFRARLSRAFVISAGLSIMLLLAEREGMITLRQVDAVVETVVDLVLKVAQQVYTVIKPILERGLRQATLRGWTALINV